jgi:nucleoside phosphorylase
MASKHSRIKRATDELKSFLEENSDDYEAAYHGIRYNSGWAIPYRSGFVFQLMENLYSNLYDGLLPLLASDNRTPDEAVIRKMNYLLLYLENEQREFEDIHAKSEDGVFDTATGTVYELSQRVIDKLKEVTRLAQEDLQQSTASNQPPINPPQTNKPAAPLVPYDYSGVKWYDPKPISTKDTSRKRLSKEDRVIDVAIIVATPTELLHVLRLLKPLPKAKSVYKVTKDFETYYLGLFGRYRAVVCKSMMGESGPLGSAMVANAILTVWKPLVLLMIGIAFGASRENQQAADVLVARDVLPYEAQRVGESIVYRSSIPTTSEILVNRFDNAQGWKFRRPDKTRVKAIIGRLFSGSKLIDEPIFKATLLAHDSTAIGGEMEGAGVWAAAARKRVEWILVKGVCDWADGTKDNTLQQMAAASAASLCHHVLSSKGALNGLKRAR